MGFFQLIGIVTFLYYLISILLWIILDTDIELFVKEKFGKRISKFIFSIIRYMHIMFKIKRLKIIHTNINFCYTNTYF